MTLRQGLSALILVLGALLALALGSALVDHSLAVFIVVSVACWAAVFAGTVALSRNISRRDRNL
jgi:hypothetical protein